MEGYGKEGREWRIREGGDGRIWEEGEGEEGRIREGGEGRRENGKDMGVKEEEGRSKGKGKRE